MNDNERKQQEIQRLSAELVKVREDFKTAIEALGLKVKSTVGTNGCTILEVTSKKPEVTERFFSYSVRMEVDGGSWRSSTAKLAIAMTKDTGYNRERKRWSIPANALKAIVETLAQAEIDAVNSQKASVASDVDRCEKDAKMAQELKGLVVPPGVDVKVIYGNGPGAGMYRMEFERYGGGSALALSNLNLTAEQVRRMSALLNEFAKANGLYIIRATRKMQSGDTVEPYTAYYDGSSWFRNEPLIYRSLEAANDALVRANDALPALEETKAEVVPYTEYAKI